MKEIYTFSQNTIAIDLGDSSSPVVDADSIPTVDIIDPNTNLVLFTGNATQQMGGNYTFTIPFYLTTTERTLKVNWKYAISGNNIVQPTNINVVTPYLTLDDLRELSGLQKTDAELKMIEQSVRNVINTYTAQSFGTANKTYVMASVPYDAVTLPERCWKINSIYSQYDTTTDLYAAGAWVLVDPYTLKTQFNYGYGDIYYEDYLVTGPIQAPIIYSDQHFFVPHTYILTVNGNFGWENVPADISWAARRLANTYLCQDDIYRVKQVSSVGSNTWTLDFDKGVFSSTGDLDVDQILDAYYTPNMGVV